MKFLQSDDKFWAEYRLRLAELDESVARLDEVEKQKAAELRRGRIGRSKRAKLKGRRAA